MSKYTLLFGLFCVLVEEEFMVLLFVFLLSGEGAASQFCSFEHFKQVVVFYMHKLFCMFPYASSVLLFDYSVVFIDLPCFFTTVKISTFVYRKYTAFAGVFLFHTEAGFSLLFLIEHSQLRWMMESKEKHYIKTNVMMPPPSP